MRAPHVGDEVPLPVVERGERDDSPDRVAEDHGHAERGRDHEEALLLAVEAHGARPHAVGQHVHQGKGARHCSEAKAHH